MISDYDGQNRELFNNKLEKCMLHKAKHVVTAIDSGDHKALAYSLFIASGIEKKKDIKRYMKMLNNIQKDFKAKRNPRYKEFCETGKAQELHNYLWNGYENKERAREKKFNFADAVYRQVRGSESVGNCVGLTTLYGTLALMNGIDFYALISEDFIDDIGSHIMGRVLKPDGEPVDIECTNADGFGQGQSKNFNIHSPSVLISCQYNNLAGIFINRGDYEDAFKNFSKSLIFTPKYVLSVAGMGMYHVLIRNFEEGLNWANKAIEIKEDSCIAHTIKGGIYRVLGDHASAEESFEKAVSINPLYRTASNGLSVVRDTTGILVDGKTLDDQDNSFPK
jgi:hypothetical protein